LFGWAPTKAGKLKAAPAAREWLRNVRRFIDMAFSFVLG
jgi:hypothetical protein